MSAEAMGLRPDLYQQLAATNPFAGRARRLFGRGQVTAVRGNEADLRVGYGARGNALELKQVPIVSGYAPQVGDWVAIGYEAGHSGAPWVMGPSMGPDASADPPGIGVFAVCASEPVEAAVSTIYFDEPRGIWRGFNGSAWVDLGDTGQATAHNSLSGLQGGTASEYYHLTAAEYGGTWQHALIAFDDVVPMQGHRTTALTDEYASALFAKHITTGNMADGFGVGVLFAVEDDAGVESNLGRLAAVRAGADNTGDFAWYPATAGVLNERMRLTSAGALNVGAGGYASAVGGVGADHIGVGVAEDGNYRLSTDGPYAIRMSRAGSTDTWGVVLTGTYGGALLFRNITDSNLSVMALSEDYAQIGAADGTAANPSLSFFNEWTKGFYSPAAGQVGLALDGMLRCYWEGYTQILGSYSSTSNAYLLLYTGSGCNSAVYFRESSSKYGHSLVYDGAFNKLFLYRHSNSAAGSVVTTWYRDSDLMNLTPGTDAPSAEGDFSNRSDLRQTQSYLGGRPGNLVRTLAYQSADQAGDKITGNTAETVFASGSCNVPTALWATGKKLRIRAWGVTRTGAGGTAGAGFSVRVRIGSSAVALADRQLLVDNGWSIPAGTSTADHMWEMEAEVSCRSTGAGGTMVYLGHLRRSAGTGDLESSDGGASYITGDRCGASLRTKNALIALNTTATQVITVSAAHSTDSGQTYSQLRGVEIWEVA